VLCRQEFYRALCTGIALLEYKKQNKNCFSSCIPKRRKSNHKEINNLGQTAGASNISVFLRKERNWQSFARNSNGYQLKNTKFAHFDRKSETLEVDKLEPRIYKE
jgi:hypothetical protein